MDNSKIIGNLISLTHLDIDAFHAYAQAIEKIDVQSVKDQLTRFQSDHLRHVENLSAAIKKLGGQPPEFKRDFKGYLIEGMTTLRSVTGTEGALKAMKTNEHFTNSTYEKALAWDLPADVKTIVQQNRDDERRHLEFIVRSLDSRVWEASQEVA